MRAYCYFFYSNIEFPENDLLYLSPAFTGFKYCRFAVYFAPNRDDRRRAPTVIH